MTTIKATCPMCGDVDLAPSDVRLTVAGSSDGSAHETGTGWARYTFTCSGCSDQVAKTADHEVVALLSSAGVQIDHVPAEALEPRTGPALTYDDLLDFAMQLHGEGLDRHLAGENDLQR